ncbi:Hypothetical protein SMAX5B_007258 [Scophthalmus maximus]|uniref:Uncharacterized protein n=1 Tax=Scophthalmus maximus TaxID=52904 RepID=A0A2U9BHG3_SCOMX|nr:Hypothetical protein SMAX5B_007258 [Scophthalmus maximus]
MEVCPPVVTSAPKHYDAEVKGKEKIRALKVQNALLEEDSLVKKVAKQLSNTGQLRGQDGGKIGKPEKKEGQKKTIAEGKSSAASFVSEMTKTQKTQV